MMTTPADISTDLRPPLWAALAIAILPVVAASIAGSAVTVPQIPTWYAGLAKPPFNPPNWIFAPVWTTLFALMALGAFRILRRPVGTPGRRRYTRAGSIAGRAAAAAQQRRPDRGDPQ